MHANKPTTNLQLRAQANLQPSPQQNLQPSTQPNPQPHNQPYTPPHKQSYSHARNRPQPSTQPTTLHTTTTAALSQAHSFTCWKRGRQAVRPPSPPSPPPTAPQPPALPGVSGRGQARVGGVFAAGKRERARPPQDSMFGV